jgi:hypothetical protein
MVSKKLIKKATYRLIGMASKQALLWSKKQYFNSKIIHLKRLKFVFKVIKK